MLKNALPALYLLKARWILTKPAQICHGDIDMNSLDIGDLDPIFKVTGGQRTLKNALSAFYLLKG